MNYSKIYNHKKRVVIPFLNVEVRGYLNLFIALIPTFIFGIVAFFLISYLAIGLMIPIYIGTAIFLNISDEENNGILKKYYLKTRYKEDLNELIKLNNNKKTILRTYKKDCDQISFNNYRRLNV